MPKGYQHLTRTQRCQIQTLKASGFLQKDIAKALNISNTTVSNELKRNSSSNGNYDFHEANTQARIRRWKASSKPRRMTPELIKKIEAHILEGWSPEQISGRLKLSGTSISHERIYQHIWDNKKNHYGTLYRYLRHSGKKYRKRSNSNTCRSRIADRIDIKERPEIVETKSRVGDWEGDTIIGAQQSGAILSYVERKSKFTLLSKLPRKTSEKVLKATTKKFKNIPKSLALTITYDNGTEFAAHKEITRKTGAKCYFATPYHAWERGLNEHTNGLVRKYFPKSSRFTTITDKEIKMVENLLNNRPRKVLGYRTPKEIFAEATRKISLQG